MTSTDPLSLDAIEARANAAEDGWHVVFDNDTYRHEIHGDGPTHVAVFGGNPDDAFASYPVEANAEFAAHARTDVPLLLAEVRRLRARVWELERPAVEAERAKVRDSFADLIAAATEARDYEGAFDVECRLREREEQWKREDAARPEASTELADTRSQVADEVVEWSGRQVGVHVPTVDAIAALLRRAAAPAVVPAR